MSLVLTKVQDLRAQSPDLSKWTNRPSMYGALDTFKNQTDQVGSIISPDLKARAMAAVGRGVAVPVFDEKTVSITSTRSVTIADDENTSDLYTVSFTIYSFGFTMAPALYMTNEHSYSADWNKKFLSGIYALGASLDSACLSALDTNKTQVFGDNLGYTVTANVVTPALAAEQEIIGDMSVIMNSNDFYGQPFDIVANTGLQSVIMKMYEKSIYNESNKTIQFADKNFHFTNRLANPASTGATGYIVNPNSVGLLFRHEREALLGTQMFDAQWEMVNLPLLNIPADAYYYESRGDYNALGGTSTADWTRGRKEHYGFSVEMATVVSHNSDLATYASPIAKFAIATT